MDKLKLQLAASVLYKGAGKITGIDYHNMTGLPEELSHISESADSIIKSSTSSSEICRTIFNSLNGNKSSCGYEPSILSGGKINYPTADPTGDFGEIRKTAAEKFADLTDNYTNLNSLLELIEDYGSYIPSGKEDDISVYDHVRLTAALSFCIYDWLSENSEWTGRINTADFLKIDL